MVSREPDPAPGHEMANTSNIRTYPSENESASTTYFILYHNLTTICMVNEDGLPLALALEEHIRKGCGKGKRKRNLSCKIRSKMIKNSSILSP